MTALGILVALTAAVANALAVVLQAAEARRAPLAAGGRPSLLLALARRPRWLAGTGLLIVAWPLQVLALALAPITVVQPALAATALVLLGLARLRLGERAGRPELAGAAAIVAGIALVAAVAPHHSSRIAPAGRLAPPLVIVGLAAAAAYVVGRRHRGGVAARVMGRRHRGGAAARVMGRRHRRGAAARVMGPGHRGGAGAMVVAAGLAYAWTGFANKLLASELSRGRLAPAAAWLAAAMVMGGLAFLEENTALQRRPAVTVAPVIGAIGDPLPVVMALWAGVESWGAGPGRIAALAVGLGLATGGALVLGRSRAVARVATRSTSTASIEDAVSPAGAVRSRKISEPR